MLRTTRVCLLALGAACGGGGGPAADAPIGPSIDSAAIDARGVDASAACEVGCGAAELCGSIHAGLDDNCDGMVDEGCACSPGQASRCFAGDPTYRGTPGCFDGVMRCDAAGTWGPCAGGRHPNDSPACFEPTTGCHALASLPFASTGLDAGLGDFGSDAITESFTVGCPPGVAPCPAVTGAGSFAALQVGEYGVHYTKTIAGGGTDSCDFPLFVAGPGLRVELQWEHDLGGTGVDLDLHLHEPATTTPHSVGPPLRQDCTWNNCGVTDLQQPEPATAPTWFPTVATPPDPVSWYLDPVLANNTCYFAPAGRGPTWQAIGLGCHNPRLDLDNISCDAVATDPNDATFCAPEEINIDFMPVDAWTRISVAYFSSHGEAYAVHPRILVYFAGELAADLGPRGYYTPEAPVTFTAVQGADGLTNVWWMVADVEVVMDGCGARLSVQPIYADAGMRTPLLTTAQSAEAQFGPPYP